MPAAVVIGTQWGDEGKGKIVDLLAADADIVVRFHGGNNAGHTLVVNGEKTVLNLIPAGVLHPGRVCMMGPGLVIDPEVLVAEIGTDMTKFPTAGHLASWAGMCPGNDPSAGKRRSGRTTKGSRWLRATLVQVAWAAVHAKGTIFGATYRRWAKRLGKKKALVAVGHKILGVVYELLKTATDYRERWTPEQAA